MTSPAIIHFVCWNCKTDNAVDLQHVQEDRLEINYQAITPNPDAPRRYHVKCGSCGKFNTVYL